jgi:hypothetical protein
MSKLSKEDQHRIKKLYFLMIPDVYISRFPGREIATKKYGRAATKIQVYGDLRKAKKILSEMTV